MTNNIQINLNNNNAIKNPRINISIICKYKPFISLHNALCKYMSKMKDLVHHFNENMSPFI